MPTLEKQLENAERHARIEKAKLATDAAKAKRQMLKLRLAALSTYKGAKRDRTNRDWRAPNVSADIAAIGDGETLRARARQLCRDDDYAASIIRAFKRNVVGTGITPSWSTDSDEFNRDALKLWRRWSRDARYVDRERRRNFVQIQKWAIGEMVEVGEALIVIAFDDMPRSNVPGLVLQCIEAEQLDNTIQHHEGNEVRGGVEVDEFGAAVAYHVYNRHPNDIATRTNRWRRDDIRIPGTFDDRDIGDKQRVSIVGAHSVRIPADRILHIYDPERARQTRGVTRFASSMARLRDLGTYDMAQLLAAKAEACMGLVIKKQLGTEDFDTGLSRTTDDNKDSDNHDELSLQPIMSVHLEPGEDVTGFTPTRPGGQYDPFVTKQLRAVAAGVGLSFEQVARDFTGGTYSSQRQGMLEDRREYEPMQQLIIDRLCQPIVERFIAWSVLQAMLVPVEDTDAMTDSVNWQGQGWEWIDPQKQADGTDKMLSLGLTTLEIEANKLGRDWRELQAQRAIEQGKEMGTRQVEGDGQLQTIEVEDAPLNEVIENPVDQVSDQAKNIVEGEKLNGAQITSAVGVISSVINDQLPADVGVELLVAVGIDDTKARRMVASADEFEPDRSKAKPHQEVAA